MMYVNVFKDLIDKVVSSLLLVLFSPLIIIISFLIFTSSKGPIIFKQNRVGKNGRVFTIYKFRTMKTNVNPNGQSPTEIDDPRITKAGKYLRKTSLDELPQLFNVLKGDMSLVGPRPLLTWQAEEFNEYEAQRLKVKPGITGLAQVNGRGQLTWEEKVNYDIEYVNNVSLLLDIKILFKTFIKVVKKENVYETKQGAWKNEGM